MLALMFAALTAAQQPMSCDEASERYYSFDGTCNNLANPNQGAAHTLEVRTGEGVDYGRQFDPLPSVRAVSNLLFKESHEGTTNTANLSLLTPIFGQFLVHDLVATEQSRTRVMLDPVDPDVDFFSMSLAKLMGGDRGQNQTINEVTSYLDLSVVYGSSREVVLALRTMSNGLLKTSNEELAQRGGARYKYTGKSFPTLCSTCVDLREQFPKAFDVQNDNPMQPEPPACSVRDCDGELPGVVCGLDEEYNQTSGKYRDFIYTPIRDWLPLFTQAPQVNSEIGRNSETFVAGDSRASENAVLATVHTLFLRNHNRIARQLRVNRPEATDEELFQEARRTNIHQYQDIIYREYLPALLGEDRAPSANGAYSATTDASISNLFASAAFRLHTLLPTMIKLRYRDGRIQSPENGFDRQPLVRNSAGIGMPEEDLVNNELAFTGQAITGRFSAAALLALSGGEDAIMKTSVTQLCNKADVFFTPSLRDIKMDMKCATRMMPAGRMLMDIPSQSLARGRQHGIPGYDEIRKYFHDIGSIYQLPECRSLDIEDSLACFARITGESDEAAPIASALKQLYGKVSLIDPFAGMSAELPVSGSQFGSTQTTIIVEQFERLRDGDRFFYTHNISESELAALRDNSMKAIIEANFDVDVMQNNAFFVE